MVSLVEEGSGEGDDAGLEGRWQGLGTQVLEQPILRPLHIGRQLGGHHTCAMSSNEVS